MNKCKYNKEIKCEFAGTFCDYESFGPQSCYDYDEEKRMFFKKGHPNSIPTGTPYIFENMVSQRMVCKNYIDDKKSNGK
jgi:hypothetical protein